jgi:hypothetical protein
VSECSKCGKAIRFIKRAGKKALVVNAQAIYFIPDDNSTEEYVLTNGDIRKGKSAPDGLRGFKLHQC